MNWKEYLSESKLPSTRKLKDDADYSDVEFDLILSNLVGLIEYHKASLETPNNKIASSLKNLIKYRTEDIKKIKEYKKIFKVMPTTLNISEVYTAASTLSPEHKEWDSDYNFDEELKKVKLSAGTKKALKSKDIKYSFVKILEDASGGVSRSNMIDASGRFDGGAYYVSLYTNDLIEKLQDSIREYKNTPKKRLKIMGVTSFSDFYYGMAKIQRKYNEAMKNGEVWKPI